jgi:hypothetical protein
MSASGNSRNRSSEATERLRAERRGRGECELCSAPAHGKARCAECYARINGNTKRYVGQPRKGPPERIKIDLVDLHYAADALSKGLRGFMAVQDAAEPNPRRRRELLIEPRAQIDLARRFLQEVLDRNPELP